MKLAFAAAPLLLLAPAAYAQTTDAPAPQVDIHAHYTLDTPIKDLIADPAAKAVLDKDLPGLSTDENLAKFEDKSLRDFQPLTGGQLTDDLLKQTGADLAAIGSDDTAPAEAGPSASADKPTQSAAPSGDAPTGR